MALVSCVFSSALAGAPKVQPQVAARANMNVQAYVGPYRYVAGGTVTVRDQAGNTLARGKTSTRGRAALRVSGRPSVKAPYAVSVTGGAVRGKRFTGTLTTHVGSVPKRFKLTRIDYATTAASKMPGANSGRFQPNLMRVMKTLGFVTRGPFGWKTTEPLRYHSYQVGDASLSRLVRWVGGYDALTTRLAKISSAGRRITGLRTKVLQLPNQNYRRRSRVGSPLPCKAPASRSHKTGKCVRPAKGHTAQSVTKSEFQTTSSGSASVGNAPCQSSYTPPSSSSAQYNAAADFGLETFAGLLSVAVTGNPETDSLALGEGVTGYAMTEMNAAVDPSGGTSPQLSDIQAQLSCISQQLANIDTYLGTIYDAVEIGTLQTILNRASTCQTNITDAYDQYTTFVDNAALAPGSYGYAPLDSSNTSLAADISSWQTLLTACGSGIDEMLFPAAASGETGGWEQAVFEAETGVFNSSDTAALSPSTTAFLQNFLAYWSTLEYQQSVVWNEYYNYQANILSPAVPQVENQQMQLGWTTTSSNPYGTCQQTASVSNVTSGTDSGCQWQQNIADVWPGTQYSDEVGLWGDTATVPSAASTNSLSGLAVSAVPYGLGTSASVNPANVGTGEMVTPQSIASLCQSSTAGVLQMNCSSTTLSGYSASNALSSFNGVSAGTYLAPYEAWFAPQAKKTEALGAGYNLTPLNGFFNQQLNATSGSSSTGPVLGSSTSPSWQVVASTNTFSANTTTSGNDANYSAQVVATSAQNLVSPWASGEGQTITMSSPVVTPNCSTNCVSAGFPLSSFPTAPAAAYLLSRPWTQGANWPTAPQMDANFVGSGQTVYLGSLSGCPSAGCTWAWGPSGPPSGFSSSSLTAAGVLTIPSGVTAPSTLTVVASNNIVATPPTTVDLDMSPGIQTVGFPGTQLASGTTWQLWNSPTCGSGCTWTLVPNGNSAGCVNGVQGPGTFTLSQSGVLTATGTISGTSMGATTTVCAMSSGSEGAEYWGIYVQEESLTSVNGGIPACTTSALWDEFGFSTCYIVPLG
ncbi:MAG: hypothetical protein NT143_01525 [Actinobacteria bacterium]|nr:hypothetical protein [Actinomycetota bacterium]